MARQSNTLAQGALLAALAAILGLSALFIPVLGVAAAVLWTIPIMVLIIRFDLRVGVMALAVALAIVLLTGGPVGALSLGLRSGFTGLVFGYALKENLSPGTTILAGGITTLIGTALLLLITYLLIGGPIIDVAEMEATMEQVLLFYEERGLLTPLLEQGTTKEELRGQLFQMLTVMITLIPGTMFMGSLASASITYLVARRVLKRLGHEIKAILPFRYWRLPWQTVWGLILGLILLLVGDYFDREIALVLGQNIVFIYLPLLLLNGLSVIIYFYRRWTTSPLFKGLILGLAVINFPISLPLVMLLGAFDPLINYRKLLLRKKEED